MSEALLSQSVSVKYDGFNIILTAKFNGENLSEIILEPRVTDELIKFIKDKKD